MVRRSVTRARSLFIALVAASLVAALVAAAPASAARSAPAAPVAREAFPGQNGLLAYSSDATGAFQVRVITPDGTRSAQRSDEGGFDPAWSADGSSIAFVSGRSAQSNEVYRMNFDGTAVTRLTNNAVDDFGPAWSPEGDKIAFDRADPASGTTEIWVMNADGTGQTRLTTNSADDFGVSWSPDGDHLAFASSRAGGDYEIFRMGPDGSNPVRLTASPGLDMAPDWSPDGSRIAFTSGRDGNAEIYAMLANGSAPTRLTDRADDDANPAWSPDGNQLAYIHAVGALFENRLVVMNADGSAVTELTTGESDLSVDWQPVQQPDTTAPEVTFTTPPAPGTIYEQGAIVHAGFQCSDPPPGTGVSSCDALVTKPVGSKHIVNGAKLPTGAAGSYHVWVTATDNALNEVQLSQPYTVVNHQPDGRIRLGAGAQVGNDVYNTTGTGQSRATSARRGSQVTFNLSIQNDGSVADIFRVRAQASTTYYAVRYYSVSPVADITGLVTAGLYQTPDLAPGASFAIRAIVTVKSSAPAGSSVTRSVTATSLGHTLDKDTVKMTVRRS